MYTFECDDSVLVTYLILKRAEPLTCYQKSCSEKTVPIKFGAAVSPFGSCSLGGTCAKCVSLQFCYQRNDAMGLKFPQGLCSHRQSRPSLLMIKRFGFSILVCPGDPESPSLSRETWHLLSITIYIPRRRRQDAERQSSAHWLDCPGPSMLEPGP